MLRLSHVPTCTKTFPILNPVWHVQKTRQNVTLYWYILYLWESLEAKMGIDEVDDVDQVA